MHQILSGLGQIAVWINSSPAAMQVTYSLLKGAKQGYTQLSPANKAKVDSLLTKASEYLANAVLDEALGWTKVQAVAMGLSTDAAEVAEAGVRRIAEVGITKTFEELRR